jgi:hypothetical protein
LQAAQQATKANRVNQYTPYGSSTYTQNAGQMADPNASWNQTISLSPVGQQLLDASNKTSLQMAGLQGQAADKYQSMLGQALPQTYQSPGAGGQPSAYDPTQSTNNASQLIMDRLQPQMQRDQEALRTQLANQGVTQNSTAYNTGMDSFNRQKNDAYLQAQLAGINLGMQQQGQTYGQQAGNISRDAQTQAQRYSQQMMNRNIPLNDLNALRSGSQVQNPTFNAVPMQATTAGPDLSGATNSLYGAQTGNVNAGNAQSGNTAAGLFGLAGATSSLWGPALMAMM